MFKSHFKQAAVFLLLPVLFLSQCNEVKTVQYFCENGEKFTLAMRSDGDWVILGYQNKRYDLRHVPAASGAKYSNGRVTCWSKGSEAILIIDEKIVCRGRQSADH